MEHRPCPPPPPSPLSPSFEFELRGTVFVFSFLFLKEYSVASANSSYLKLVATGWLVGRLVGGYPVPWERTDGATGHIQPPPTLQLQEHRFDVFLELRLLFIRNGFGLRC